MAWFPTGEEALEAAGLGEGSPGTIELARRIIGALNRRDLSTLTSCAHSDVEWHSFFAQLGEGGVYHGHDGARRWMRDLDDAWEVVRAEVDDEIAVGDVAVFTGRIHYRGKGSGIEAEAPTGWMLKFRDARLILFRAFRDPAKALEAIGLEG